jgi:hypothetical protein
VFLWFNILYLFSLMRYLYTVQAIWWCMCCVSALNRKDNLYETNDKFFLGGGGSLTNVPMSLGC